MINIIKIIFIIINLHYSLSFSPIIEKICKNIKKDLLHDESISYYNINIEIKYRIKKTEKILHKIKKKKKYPMDIIGLRIVYDSDNEDISFKILSNIERNNFVIPNTYKNYINNKKINDYQSLHICILYYIIPIEIQIRNLEMDHIINYGKPSNYIY